MLTMVLETLADLDAGRAWAANMITAEQVNHDQLEVPSEVFSAFFGVVHETLRDFAGEGWTPAMEAAWSGVVARAGELGG